MLDPTTDPHPGKIDLTQKHQAHPENLETPTLTQLFELPKFSQLTHFPGWAAHYDNVQYQTYLKSLTPENGLKPHFWHNLH